ncbi:caspase family protein [Caballeronia sp. GaOx3]|uniref:caspase family protein n=1 Tax=Caballeronia sp. GaOx3 TaxID=2921740 RepID=UPI0020295D06|nr:caspase family protein [Caballeronia sp. GaOx3]
MHLGKLTRSGSVAITPFASGPLRVRWKMVVGLENNTNLSDVSGTAAERLLNVATGTPSLTVTDPVFFAGQPARTILSPDGTVRLEDYGDHFRVVDAKSLEEVFQGAGAKPSFSPTGRFIYFFAARSVKGGPDYTALQVLDRSTGQIIISRQRGEGVGQDTVVSLRWGIHDAILALGLGKGAGVETYATLIDRQPYFVSLGPNCCDAIEEGTAVQLDVDNLLLRYKAKQNGFDSSKISSLAFSTDGAWRTLAPQEFALLSRLRTQDDADPDELHSAPDGRMSLDVSDSLDENLVAFLTAHRVQDRQTKHITLKASKAWDSGGRILAVRNPERSNPAVEKAGFSRGADQLSRVFGEIPASRQGPLRSDRFAQRLIDLGFSLQRPAQMTEYSFLPPNGGIMGVAAARKQLSAIFASMPQAKKFFLTDDNFCNPLILQGKELSKIAPRSIIAMREFQDADLSAWVIVEGCSTSGSVDNYYARVALISRDGKNEPRIVWLNEKVSGTKSVDETMGLKAIPVPAPNFIAQLYDRRHLLFSIGDRPELLDYDMNSGGATLFRAVSARTGAAFGLYRTADGRNIRLDKDGSVHIFSANQQRESLSGRYIDDEIVLFNDAGFYDGSEEGARYAYLSFPGITDLASLRQYQSSLKRPFIKDAARGQPIPQGVRPDVRPPPTLTLTLNSSSHGVLMLDVRATSVVGLAEIDLFLDGKQVHKIAVSGLTAQQRIELPLPAPAIWATAQAIDKSGTESAPVSLAIPPDARLALAKPHVHVIAVGTDVYDDPSIHPLTGAVADATAFVSLAARSKLYVSDPSVKPIVNSSRLKEEMLEQVDAISKSATSSDTTMVLISGHGLRTKDGKLFLASRTTRLHDVERTSIDWEEISRAMSKIPGRLVVFLDTCHAGAADASNDTATESLVSQKSVLIFSASKGRQKSLEKGGAGVFTGTMVKLASRGFKTVDRNGNGVIELDELYRTLKVQVLTETSEAQTPWIARNGFVGPVPIF